MPPLTIDMFNIARKALRAICSVLTLAVASQAQANAYAVQVGAFAAPSPALAESYRQYG
ncbi:MAG: hypothetical protein HKO71_08530, partial [Pseudomonadales bacterium]|nr:hypothetical protein [Pseudomonadales bacterium]